VLTPDGVVHEVTDPTDTDAFEPGGVAIIGLTRDSGAIVAPHEGGLVRLQLVQQGDRWRFERIPLSDEVAGTGAASADGRYFATGVYRGDTVIYDLSTNQVARRLRLSTNVYGYSDRVLWEDRGSYVLGFGPDRVEIPMTHLAVVSGRAEIGGDIVAIGDPRPATQLYDVSDGTARPIGTIEGHGALSPDGRYYLSPIQKEPGYRWELQKPLTLWERDGDASRPVTGVDDAAGPVWSIGWLDTDTAAVVTSVPHRATIWTCEASTRQCEEVYSFPSTQSNFVSWLIGH
jgi:WD40 repeat protein